ncbi:MAG: endolytic transglycosylase MltG [Prochloraceae cyanobacterium]|nr:endolytic transglycosylase MltG [Prochloraceae cyanobacterium]
MKFIKNLVSFVFFTALLSATLGTLAWFYAISAPISKEEAEANQENSIALTIPSGTPAGEIGTKLARKGLIRSAYAWKIYTRWLQFKENKAIDYKAGNYQLSAANSLPEIAATMRQGQVKLVDFTIPEGWNIKQMAQYFESSDFFSADEFIAATRKIPQDKYPWLPNNLPHLEGFLYPDTYKISSDRKTPEQVIYAMLDRFEALALPAYQANQQKTNLNLLEWVTLASIVEKESVIGKERPIIAGVFSKRLAIGMRLQADPTVEYGLGIKQTADRPLTYAEVAKASPYNTYVNKGLPPTAIASPGIASLKATLEPQDEGYLYFVARYDGTHVFSKTYSQHLAAMRQIRQQRRANK